MSVQGIADCGCPIVNTARLNRPGELSLGRFAVSTQVLWCYKTLRTTVPASGELDTDPSQLMT